MKMLGQYLKKKKFHLFLFVSTREVGAYNYMSWDQIKEMQKKILLK